MALPQPLNQAVIAQALYDLRNGRLRRWQSMGCSARLLEALKHPELVSVLANSIIPWCSVRINLDIAHKLLDQQQNVATELATIDRMLTLGASSEMVTQFFGLVHQEVAVRRRMLELPSRTGRWPVLTEEQDAGLWKSWKMRVEEQGIELRDEAAMLNVAMDLAEGEDVPLSVVWSAIRGWIDQGLT